MRIIDAKKAGAQAFKNGKGRAPALNQAFLFAACESDTDTAELLGAYLSGWDVAKLANAAQKIGIASAPSAKALQEIEEGA